jgi:tRNA-splicing ligase RtcB
MERAVEKYKISIPDRELACAPAQSNEAQDYYEAMACAVNYAFVNRQVITHWVRQSFEEVLKRSADSLGLDLVYDVAHNIAKIEEHTIEAREQRFGLTVRVRRVVSRLNTRMFQPITEA